MKKLAETSPSGQKLYNMVISQTADATYAENESELSEEHAYRHEPLCNEIFIPQATTPAFGKSLSVVSYKKEECKVDQNKREEIKFEQFSKPNGFKTEAFIKFIIRKFRETIKKNFQKVHGNKYNFWIPSTLRANVKDFFTKHSSKRQNYMIPEDVYDENEAIFFKLVINTKKNSQIDQFKGDKQVVDEMDQIFRSAPKIAYL